MANVQTITCNFIDEGASRETGLQSNALDMVYDMQLENVASFDEDGAYGDQYSVYTYAQKFLYYLAPNCSEDSLCNDINLRLAIFNAIDQDGLITALGGGYTRGYAFMSDYYSDYVDWSGLDNYNTKSSVDASVVQEYLDASSYNGETLVFMCQSDFNDVLTIIVSQLAAYGINAEIKGLDQATMTSTLLDSAAWDVAFGTIAGDYNVQAWSHAFDYNSNGGTGTASGYFNTDDEWQELLELVNTADGHTEENMQAWWEMAVDNAYVMGLYNGDCYDIVPSDCTYVCLTDRLNLQPGACCYDGSVE